MYELLYSWNYVLKVIMKAVLLKEDIHIADVKIRIFLTLFARIDQKIRQKNEKPKWITSYNFLCLLNIPEMMENFGPVRNLWEGKKRSNDVRIFLDCKF